MDFARFNEIISENVDVRDVAIDMLALPYKRLGGRINILCPLPDHHDHDFGSCIVKEHYGYCFACNQGFNAISLVMNIESIPYLDAVKKLDSYFGLNLDFSYDTNPVDPIIIPADILRFAGISDIQLFRKLFEENRTTALEYLKIMVVSAGQKYCAQENAILPPEIRDALKHRIETLRLAVHAIPKWNKMPPSSPLRIKS